MALETIITQIKSILQGVAGIGVVHDYERNANDKTTFLSLFTIAAGQLKNINGWTIIRRNTEETLQSSCALTGRRVINKHTIVIRGYCGFQDDAASEKTFRVLVENIRTALRGNYTLNGSVQRHDFPQSPVNETRMMAGTYLVHYCEIELTVQEELII